MTVIGPCGACELGWFGHVVGKDDQQWVRKCMDLKVDDCAGRVRARKSWLECVNDNMKKLGLKKRDGTQWTDCGSRLSWEC